MLLYPLSTATASEATLSTSARWLAGPLRVGRVVGAAVGSGRLFVADAERNEIVVFRQDSGEVDKRIKLGLGAPKGLAFDGTSLWVADEKTRKIHAYSVATGKPVRAIPIEAPPEKGYRSVEGLTWDGSHLWTAIAAGFSSSFNQIDASTGRIHRSLFADCDPRGLASDGQSLWSLCFNGAQHPATVDRRTLGTDEPGFQRSRTIVGKVDSRATNAILVDAGRLWIFDGAKQQLTPLPVER